MKERRALRQSNHSTQVGPCGQEVAEHYASATATPNLKTSNQSVAFANTPVWWNTWVSLPLLLQGLGPCLPDFAQGISLVEPQLLPEPEESLRNNFSLPAP